MNEFLTVAKVTGFVVVAFTLFFQLVPGLRVKWATLSSDIKRRIVIGLYLVTGTVVGFGGCFPAFAEALGLPLLCVSSAVFVDFVFGMLLAVGAGQGAYELLPELKDVTAAKAVRDAKPV